MYALLNSQIYDCMEEKSQEECFAKNSLYELAEAEDRMNLEITYRRSPILAYKMDSIDEWGIFAASNSKLNSTQAPRKGSVHKI